MKKAIKTKPDDNYFHIYATKKGTKTEVRLDVENWTAKEIVGFLELEKLDFCLTKLKGKL